MQQNIIRTFITSKSFKCFSFDFQFQNFISIQILSIQMTQSVPQQIEFQEIGHQDQHQEDGSEDLKEDKPKKSQEGKDPLQRDQEALNHAYIHAANHLIDCLVKDYANRLAILLNTKFNFLFYLREIHMIMDIGCGSGYYTSLLSQRINCDLIIAVDMNEKRIERAKKNYSKPNIVFLAIDMSKSFEQFNDNLIKLKGKISVAFCSHVFCAIRRNGHNNLMRNIRKLLVPNGIIYSNMCIHFDGYGGHRLSLVYQYFYFRKVDSVNSQCDHWISILKRHGFKLNKKYLFEIKTHLSEAFVRRNDQSLIFDIK